MNIAAKNRSVVTRSLVIGVAALAAVITIGAAFLLRGPDLAYVPKMADKPFRFDDGHEIFVQKYEVTIAEWNRCFADGACHEKIVPQPGLGPETTPATGLSYLDVEEYLAWVNAKSRHAFRLPTLAEWEAIAHEVLPDEVDPIFTDPELRWASAYLVEGRASRALREQGAWKTSSLGIADLDGSVWEWTQDCFSGDAAADESCPAYFVGGEHVAAMSFMVRDPALGGCAVGTPPAHLGMRLVSDRPIGVDRPSS